MWARDGVIIVSSLDAGKLGHRRSALTRICDQPPLREQGVERRHNRATARVSLGRTINSKCSLAGCAATDLLCALPASGSPKESVMMYAAVSGAIVVGVLSILSLRKAKQNRDIFYFHEE